MKITKLLIRNFLTIGEIECQLDGKGLVLVQGENKDDTSQDSNGSGKSSFPDAISWCLFGITAREEKGDAVINNNAKKNCEVKLTIEDGSATYVISRHRKHKTYKNQLIVESVDASLTVTDLSKGTDSLTQELVNKIIGCSADVFNAAIYSGQEKMIDLPAMTDKQLKMLVEEAAGVDRLQMAHAEANTRLRDAKSEFSLLVNKRDGESSKLSAIEEQVAQVESRKKKWVEDNEVKIKAKSVELKDIKSAYDEAKELLPKSEAQEANLRAELAKIDAAIKAVESQRENLDKLTEFAGDLSRKLARAESESVASMRRAKSLGKELSEIDGRVGKECGECGKECTEHDLADIKKIAKQRVRDAVKEAKLNSAIKEDADKAHQSALEDVSKFKSGMTDVSAEIKRRDVLTDEIHGILDEREGINDLGDNMRRLLKEIKALKTGENPHTETLESLKASSIKIKTGIDKLIEQIEDQENAISFAAEAVKVFGPAGVRAYILDTVTPFLNSRTSHYLSTLTDGNIVAIWSTLSTTTKGELREKFSIDVRSDVGAKSFKGLSGGEKRKVRLACSMALQDLVSSRASKPIELYVADEIDHALDESGLERLMSILDEKAKDKGTALVISHNSLSDWIRQSVTVVKESGYSRLEGAALS